MAKRRFVIHVGMPHAGGAPVAAALGEHAAVLAEQGVRVPARTAEEARRASAELRRRHASYGWKRKEVEGSWALLAKRARKEGAKSGDTVVVSDELLAGASTSEIALLLDSLGGFEVHVLAVLADPASQLVAGWGESVRRGSTSSLKRYARRVLDPDRRHEDAQRFWADHDVPASLARWGAELRRPDRVHVVVPEPDQDPTEATWTALSRLLGVDASSVTVGACVPAATADSDALALLREVNRAVDGRADLGQQGAIVEQHVLPRIASAQSVAPRLPAELDDDLAELAGTWASAIAAGGYALTGDTAALTPSTTPATPPAAPDLGQRLESATDTLADMVVEMARMRERVGELEKQNAKLEKKKQKLRTRLAAVEA